MRSIRGFWPPMRPARAPPQKFRPAISAKPPTPPPPPPPPLHTPTPPPRLGEGTRAFGGWRAGAHRKCVGRRGGGRGRAAKTGAAGGGAVARAAGDPWAGPRRPPLPGEKFLGGRAGAPPGGPKASDRAH